MIEFELQNIINIIDATKQNNGFYFMIRSYFFLNIHGIQTVS